MLEVATIVSLADQSPLRVYSWPDRGPAPKAYIRGMSVAFAVLYALLKNPDDGSVSQKALMRSTRQQIGDPADDSLAWYAVELSQAGASLGTAGAKLVALFAIMLGLGMRESSGCYCVGADTPESRGEPTTEENAEAGLFQVSYDSVGSDPLREALFNHFISRTDLLEIFQDGVGCGAKDWLNYGTRKGAVFQETMKKCPLFATLYTAQFLRGHRRHWGPINRKEVEIHQDAVRLFLSIKKLIDDGNIEVG